MPLASLKHQLKENSDFPRMSVYCLVSTNWMITIRIYCNKHKR